MHPKTHQNRSPRRFRNPRSSVYLGLLTLAMAVPCMGQMENALHHLPTVWDYTEVKFKWEMTGEVQAFLNEGLNDLRDQNPVGALHQLTAVARMDPKLWVAFYYRAMAFKQIGMLSNAKADLLGVYRIRPNSFEIPLELAKICIILQSYEEADRYIHAALKLKTRDPLVNYFYAILDYERGYRFDALKEFANCAKFDPTFLHGKVQIARHELERTTNRGGGLAMIQEVLQKDSLHEEARYLRYGVWTDLGNTKEAYADIDFLVRYAPLNPEFRLIRVNLGMQLGLYDQAYLDARKAMEGIQRMLSRGIKEFEGKRIYQEKSLDLINAGQYLNRKMYGLKESDAALVRKGFTYLVLSRTENCTTTLVEVSERDKHALVPYLLGIAAEHRNDYAAAFILYGDALKLDPEIFDAHKKRAAFRIQRREFGEARENLKAMAILEPDNIVTTRLQGALESATGNLTAALEAFTRCLAADTTDSQSMILVGLCHKKMNNTEAAVRFLVQAKAYGFIDYPLVNKTLDTLIAHEKTSVSDFARLILRIPEQSQSLDYSIAYLKSQMVLQQWAAIDAQWVRLEKTGQLEYYKQYGSALMLARGVGYLAEEKYAKAEKLLVRSMEYDGTNWIALTELGKAYLGLRETDKAKEVLQKAIQLGDKRAERLVKP